MMRLTLHVIGTVWLDGLETETLCEAISIITCIMRRRLRAVVLTGDHVMKTVKSRLILNTSNHNNRLHKLKWIIVGHPKIQSLHTYCISDPHFVHLYTITISWLICTDLMLQL